MKPWRLTKQAELSLKNIALWTFNQFGKKQAIKYRDELIKSINRLASNNPPLSKSCEQLMKDTNISLYYFKQGSHFIVFRHTEAQLEILDFFHERMDLPRHIKNLNQGK